MQRTRFNIPSQSVSQLSSREFRTALKEALILALASKPVEDVLAEHGAWYDRQAAQQGVHTARIRIYEHETLINRVACYKIRERSVVVSYGMHLRDMVLNQYVPLALRMPHHEAQAAQLVHDNGGQVRQERAIPHQESRRGDHLGAAEVMKSTSELISNTEKDITRSHSASTQSDVLENVPNKPAVSAINELRDATDKARVTEVSAQKLAQETPEVEAQGESENDDLSMLRNMAQGLF